MEASVGPQPRGPDWMPITPKTGSLFHAETQGRLMQHRARDLLLRQQTQVINALRAHLAELGMVAAQGREGLKQLLAIIADEKDARLPIDARASLIVLAAQLQALHTMTGPIEKRLTVPHAAH